MEDGIKTFPFPVKLDDRIKMVELEFGIQGYAVVWKLHQAIYSHGYYLKWDIDTQLLFIDDYRLSKVGRSLVSEIVTSCLRRGVFEASLYEKYGILTSERIQETFLTAKERSKKVIMEKSYALPIVYTFIENANKKGKNVNIFWKNANIPEQKKGKENKGNIPPTPQEGEAERNEAKEKFLNAYPKLKACTKYNDEAVDYSVLYDRFSKSAHLRETYSMKWVCSNYDLIASGAFDENSNSPSYRNEAQVVADMRGERERYYAFLHDRAISRAEKMRERANKSSAFRQADGEIKAAEIALARAESAGNEEKATELFRALEAIKERSRRALQEIGLQESDLLPNYVCKKCSDTGFTEDGRMCDCYKNNGGKT